MKSLFGPYNFYIDEFIHFALSLIVGFIFYSHGLGLYDSLFVILSGTALIDVDHVFNSFICKRILKIPNYNGTLKSGDLGYSPHIFHGIDMALLFGALGWLLAGQLFGLALCIALIVHIAWDFLVYPNSILWLFLTTRLLKRFNVGKRSYLVGKIFDVDSLRW